MIFRIVSKDKWNFSSNSFQEWIEFGANKQNQEKVVQVKDRENKWTHKALLELASPSWATYWLMCSQVVLLSSPLNL